MMPPFWRAAFRLQYRILAVIDPLIRAVWRSYGVGNVFELRVIRRNGSGVRSRLVGLLNSGGESYLGHPNGHVGWTRDLDASGSGVLRWPNGDEFEFRATRLVGPEEREPAIRATGQHPFPGNLVYRLGRRHVRSEGVYFRLDSYEIAPAGDRTDRDQPLRAGRRGQR
jgi:hypothetical protein